MLRGLAGWMIARWFIFFSAFPDEIIAAQMFPTLSAEIAVLFRLGEQQRKVAFHLCYNIQRNFLFQFSGHFVNFNRCMINLIIASYWRETLVSD